MAAANAVEWAQAHISGHFADFDAFLAALVLDRIDRMDDQAAALRESSGTGIVASNLTAAPTLMGSVLTEG